MDIIRNNYTLNCKSNEKIEGDLQSAISFIDDDILLVNFDEGDNSELILETNSTSYSKKGHYYRYKKNKGINAGGIVAIILACLVAIISVIAVMAFCKKTNTNKHDIEESTVVNINK